ncbi:MAG: T9SS type A sorting domain-containing protein [Ignavibacteriae bacterium]|nr:T9SS C-terminal target domain-containing protein [Ignavibacteriota bacterium]NOG99162.1 T9SS type A sorting domain-containing protein [Ignavibacteriota bacterium]
MKTLKYVSATRKQTLLLILTAVLALQVNIVNAQSWKTIYKNGTKMLEFVSKDGTKQIYSPMGDVDGDGIENELEVNGYFWDSDSFKMRAWNGDPNINYFITDPLQASTDQDPYSDFTEVSKVGLDVTVFPPEDDPLVAARPRIVVTMKKFDVYPIVEITDAKGGSQSSSFSNSVENSQTVGVEVTSGIEYSLEGLKGSTSVSESYSETWSTSQTSTSTSEMNWNNARSTQPDRAARLELIVNVENKGSAEALNIVPTVNLKLGDKIIATFNLPLVDALNPGQRSNDFNISTTGGDDITITLDELKAIQRRAPLTLEVNQVQADVETIDLNNNSVVKPWNIYTGDIDVVTVDIIANMGSEPKRHQVFAGWTNWNPEYSFRQVLSRIFDVEENNGVVKIEGREYPGQWYVSSPSSEVINEWETAGRPNNLLPLTMHSNTKIVMMSPGDTPEPKLNLASYSQFPGDTSAYSRILVSTTPENFPISLVTSEVKVDGVTRVDTLEQNELGFYTNIQPIKGTPEEAGKVYVKNARGDVTESIITIPAIYADAAEVKQFSRFIPNPGAEYWIYHEGDETKPMQLYCMFFDPVTGDSLTEPKEYLTIPLSEDTTNFSDWSHDGHHSRFHFNKIKIDAHTLIVDGKDTTFIQEEILFGARKPIFNNYYQQGIYGKVLYNPAFKKLNANIDLRGTPFYLSPSTVFTNNALEQINIDPYRKVIDMEIQPETYVLEGPTGVATPNIKIEYGVYQNAVLDNLVPGNAVVLNELGNNGYADMGETDNLDFSGDMTIEAWIYPEGPGIDTAFGGTIINKEGEFQIARFPDGTIRYAIADESSWEWINTYYTAPEAVWTHIALTRLYWDGGSETDIFLHNENGTEFHGYDGFSFYTGDVHPDSNKLRIGGRQVSSDQKFQGMIDEVRLWNYSRNEEEIIRTRGMDLGSEYYSTADSGLIGYWKFDELEDLGVGDPGTNDVRDYSIYENHGDLVGNTYLSNGLPTDVENNNSTIPKEYSLEQNYPNPFNPSTTISFKLPQAGKVSLTVHNILGELVKTLINSEQSAGTKQVIWNGINESGVPVSSGIYFYRLQTNSFVSTKKMMLMK